MLATNLGTYCTELRHLPYHLPIDWVPEAGYLGLGRPSSFVALEADARTQVPRANSSYLISQRHCALLCGGLGGASLGLCQSYDVLRPSRHGKDAGLSICRCSIHNSMPSHIRPSVTTRHLRERRTNTGSPCYPDQATKLGLKLLPDLQPVYNECRRGDCWIMQVTKHSSHIHTAVSTTSRLDHSTLDCRFPNSRYLMAIVDYTDSNPQPYSFSFPSWESASLPSSTTAGSLRVG